MTRFALFSLLLPGALGLAQTPTKSSPITFHVTSIRQEELAECDPKECSSKRFTIEGYADRAETHTRVSYVLTCDEMYANRPKLRLAAACLKVHANGEYGGKVFGDTISFWPQEKYSPPPYRVLYSIASEKEVNKPDK